MKNWLSMLVPENETGKQNDLEYSETPDTISEAKKLFEIATQRVFDVNHWHEITGFASADFKLKDANGRDCKRPVQEADFIRIHIPGPGPEAGDGYDWVKVEKIIEQRGPASDKEIIGIRVRSCKNPQNSTEETAHFFTDDATSSFVLQRVGNKVTASYHGRNEVVNTETDTIKDKIRNALVGAGALAGISELQWKALIKSFLYRM